MITIQLAGIPITIDNHFDFIADQCRDYYSRSSGLVHIQASLEEIQAEQAGESFDLGYCESICVYRKIALALIEYDVFLFHGAALKYHDQVLLFTGVSGSGKSTHIRLWQELFPHEVTIINGDKPLIKKVLHFWHSDPPGTAKKAGGLMRLVR